MKKNNSKSSPVAGTSVQPGAFKLKEARQYLGGLSIPTMHRLINRGLLKPQRALRHTLVREIRIGSVS